MIISVAVLQSMVMEVVISHHNPFFVGDGGGGGGAPLSSIIIMEFEIALVFLNVKMLIAE